MRITQYLKYLALFPLMLFVICGGAKAQSIVTGAINGTVTDQSDAVVDGAKVVITNNATGQTISLTSNSAGALQQHCPSSAHFWINRLNRARTLPQHGFSGMSSTLTLHAFRNSQEQYQLSP